MNKLDEIIKSKRQECFNKSEVTEVNDFTKQCMIEFAKHILEEAAENAKINLNYGYGTLKYKSTFDVTIKDKIEREHYGHGDCSYEVTTVDKQSITEVLNKYL